MGNTFPHMTYEITTNSIDYLCQEMVDDYIDTEQNENIKNKLIFKRDELVSHVIRDTDEFIDNNMNIFVNSIEDYKSKNIFEEVQDGKFVLNMNNLITVK